VNQSANGTEGSQQVGARSWTAGVHFSAGETSWECVLSSALIQNFYFLDFKMAYFGIFCDVQSAQLASKRFYGI